MQRTQYSCDFHMHMRVVTRHCMVLLFFIVCYIRYSTVRARREVSPTDGATAAKPRTGGRFYKDGYIDKDRYEYQ